VAKSENAGGRLERTWSGPCIAAAALHQGVPINLHMRSVALHGLRNTAQALVHAADARPALTESLERLFTTSERTSGSCQFSLVGAIKLQCKSPSRNRFD